MLTIVPMARRKSSSQPPTDIPPFEEAVEELTVQVQNLTGETKVLREAIDDLRVEVEWLVRNIVRPGWSLTQNATASPPAAESPGVDGPLAQRKPEVHPADDPPAPSPPSNAQQGGLFN